MIHDTKTPFTFKTCTRTGDCIQGNEETAPDKTTPDLGWDLTDFMVVGATFVSDVEVEELTSMFPC